jgi:hypothetical protein
MNSAAALPLLLAFALLGLGQADFENGNFDTKSYYRREHSLVTPYQGQLRLITIHC